MSATSVVLNNRHPKVGVEGWPVTIWGAGATLCLLLADFIWARAAHLDFDGWFRVFLLSGAVECVSLFYSSLRPARVIAEMTGYAALWLVFSAGGGVMTYLAATVGSPFADSWLEATDQALGFNWNEWANYLRLHATASTILLYCYFSLTLQISASIIIFSMKRIEGRNREFFSTAFIALMLTTIIFAFCPARGPCFKIGSDWPEVAEHLTDLAVLHAGRSAAFNIASLNGIICLPSFHTALAILFVYCHRGIAGSFPAFWAVNTLMLIAVPYFGCHYLTDMLGGAGVAISAIAIFRVATHFAVDRQ